MVQTSPWKDVLHAGTPPPMPAAIFGMATAFMGIALYLVLEVNVTVLRVFKKKRGLYFWSLIIAAWGVCFHSIGYILQWWTPGSPWALNTAFILCGWSMMVTGQSFVLYSRLHLVIRNYSVLRGCLIMIIATSILIEIPQWVTTWASTDTRLSVTKLWSPWDSIMVRISQMAFLLQEATLSLLYIWGTMKVLAPNDRVNVKRVRWDLIFINTYIILADIIILVLAYTNEHFPKEPTQNFVYAFKLKVEFVVLNQLMAITSQSRSSNFNDGHRYAKSSNFSHSLASPKPLTRSQPSGDSLKSPVSPKDRQRQNSSLATFAYGPSTKVSFSNERSLSDSSSSEHQPSMFGLEHALSPNASPRPDTLKEAASDFTRERIMVKHELQQRAAVVREPAAHRYRSSENLARDGDHSWRQSPGGRRQWMVGQHVGGDSHQSATHG